MNKIKLKKVSKADIDFLYHLLEDRELNENISHSKMPTFYQHKKFVLSKPYSKWYVITSENEKIGSIYLTNLNEIGIHLLKNYKTKKNIHDSILQLINKNPKSRYLLNINPNNKFLKEFCKSNKFSLIQHTYEFTKGKLK